MKRLLTTNVNINTAANTNNNDWTVLQAAAEKEHLEIIKRLLTANADINAAAAADNNS